MNTQKGNKLIAEFMGWKKETRMWRMHERKVYSSSADVLNNTQYDGSAPVNSLKFHKSWDWLMPVVEKLFGILYKEKSSHPRFYDTIKYISDHLIQGHIGKVWESCVWCIQWYNKQQTPYKSQKESPYLYKCEVRHA